MSATIIKIFGNIVVINEVIAFCNSACEFVMKVINSGVNDRDSFSALCCPCEVSTGFPDCGNTDII